MYQKDINQYYQEVEGRAASFPAVMRKVYTWMTLALIITGITAYGTATSPSLLNLIFSSRFTFFGLAIAELAIVLLLTARIHKMSASTATMMMILFSILNGLTMASIFILYTASSIATTFFVCSGMFAVMAIIGITTKKDLTSLGSLFFMALIGLIIASIVNIFLHNGMLDLIISGIGVIIFTGLTAYDSQNIRNMLMQQDGFGETAQKIAVIGALELYLDFINLFLYLLRFLGRRD